MSRFVLTAQLQLQAPNNVSQVVRQIQSQLNNVSVNVQVQGAAQAQRQLQQVTAQTQAATTAADRMGRAFAISIRRFAAFSIATRAVGLFTSTLSDAVRSAIDFEREMVRVSQVTGESLSQLKGFTKTVTNLSTSLGVVSSDLLQAGQLLLQAGISAKDTEVALKTLAKAALAPNFDSLSETTEGAIAILAQFGEGVGALEKQLGSINAVAGAFAVEAGDLIDVIRRAGGVFKSSGGDLNELIALFTSVRATTRESAESIGTGLRTIFTRIQRPKTIEYLKQFGVELVDLEGKFVGPFEAVKRLSTALAGLGEGDITFIRIAEELGGFRQIGKVLPLLQQFSTAQNALNVANKAGNSLTQDAATAQQALAIRILKVKEEFLALIRSMTETSTFQIMANTALSLASALIKIGEAIKPLLPLLAAVAAVNFAKGISGFAGGIMRGMQSGRTYSTGGKVHHFARGGMVPGTGNRDTVPAMLQPGEFVIKKSSVNKLGAGNLASMNKYADGGKIQINPGAIGGFFLRPEKGQDRPVPLNFNGDISNPKVLKKLSLTDGKGLKDLRQDAFYNATKEQQAQILGLPLSSQTKKITEKNPIFDKNGKFVSRFRGALMNSGYSPSKDYDPNIAFQNLSKKTKSGKLQLSEKKPVNITGILSSYFPGMDDLQTSSVSQIVAANTKKALGSAVMRSVEPIMQTLNNPIIALDKNLAKRGANRIANDANAQATTQGFIFEGLIQAITGAKLAGNQSNFDFPASSIGAARNSLRGMFANVTGEGIDSLIKADAKRSNTRDAIDSIKNKIVNDINKGKLEGLSIQKFAKGGMAQAPLIDDIVNATGTMMPRPSSAIAALIKAGGGAVDVDRTLKRTIGDQAYAMAKTSGQQSAAVDKYFRDPKARLKDVTSAPLTAFGKELQTAIKSGQLQPGKLSIISKSQRVPGVAEYLNKLFGIPLANMIFTQGGSKQPAMDALRAKGPRSTRVARFATGGGVGTDTVPALLTPGEFVINKKSAQAIGYGSLNRMNKVGKYAKGGVVQGVQRFFVGGVAEKNVSRTEGYVDYSSITQAAQDMAEIIKQLGPKIASEILDGFEGIENVQAGKKAKFGIGGEFTEGTRGRAMMKATGTTGMGLQIQGKLASANTNTLAHETGHLADYSLGGKQGLASQTQGTFQFDLVEKVKPQMEAAFKAAGKSADEIKKYLASNEELFAEFFAKASPEVRAIITSTTDSKIGMEKLKNHLQKAGHTYAGLEASDISSPRGPTRAQSMGMSTSGVLAAARSKAASAATTTPSPNIGAFGSIPRAAAAAASQSGGGGGSPTQQNTQAVAKNTQAQKSAAGSAMDVVNNNKMFAASMATSLIAGFLPAVDENSGALLKLTHSLLGFITTIASVGFALEAFGVKLTASNMLGFLTGGGMGVGNMKNMTEGLMGAGISKQLSMSITGLTQGFLKLLGPIALVTGAAWLLNKGVRILTDEIFGNAQKLKAQAIESGNVQGAGKYAAIQTSRDNMSAGLGGGAIAGAVIGTFFGGPIGAAIGGAIGAGIGALIGSFNDIGIAAAVKYAEAQAGAVKVTKALETAQKNGATAMEKFNKGLISTSELLNAFAPVFSEISNQNVRVTESVKANSATRSEYGSGKILRNLGAYLGGGLFGMETAGTRNTRLETESVGLIQGQTKAIGESFAQSREARNASIRSSLFRGEDAQKELRAKGMDTGSMQKEMSKLRIAAAEADMAGRSKEAEELRKTAALYEEEIRNTQQAMENLKKEVQIAKDKFNALNLGFRSVTASADAAAVRMTNSMNSFDLATIPGVSALNTLQASLTAAGQNISKTDFNSALEGVSGILKKFGADAKQITAFEDLTKGVATVQREFPNIFETLKKRLESGELRDLSPESLGNKFKDIVGESLDKAGIGKAAKQRIMDAMGDVKIDGEDMAKIMAGDVSVLEKYIGDAAEEVGAKIKEFGDKWITANQELIKATQERIEAERNLVAAQKEAVDLYMEGREIQAKYGGAAVTTGEKRAAILAKANAGASGAGIERMRTGSVSELRARNAQIAGGIFGIESLRGTNNSAMGAEGSELQATQQNLEQAQKDQIQTIRDLIKLEEEELKIIQEKNKLEKDSMESLISGDIDKFFEQQAAVGAQAAIATGDMTLANQFGSKAVGDAFKDIQRQQEAGVQSLFGRQLGGPGGLTEAAAGAALGARGIMDPRMAQTLAGTTPEEEASKRRLQGLGGVLTEAGAWQQATAEMKVQTAQMKVDFAQLNIDNLNNGGLPAAEGFARGGVVYANRGMFVPRGTDTVPAMLTPGEFVIRREAVNRGNNLQLLEAINNNTSSQGFARGGKVGYYNNGGKVQYKAGGGILGNIAGAFGIDPQVVTNLGNVFNKFVTGFNDSIKNLQNTKLQVKLDSVNVNVNLNGTSMLTQISEQSKQDIMKQVIQKIQNEYSVGNGGKIIENRSGLARPN